MKTALATLAALAAFPSLAAAEDALGPAPAVSVGSFAYSMDGYLSSTPAILTGFDATYDHDLTASYGLRFRAGAVLLAIDEITGVAPHGEAGAFRRLSLGPNLALDASLLAGLYGGGLDHKDEWRDHAGPTVMAELALHIAIIEPIYAEVGGGYRLAWTGDQHGSGPGSSTDPFTSGPLLRCNLGLRF